MENNFFVENSFSSIKATIRGHKKWGMFLLSLVRFVFIGLCGLPIMGFMLISYVNEHLPEIIQGIAPFVIAGLLFYTLYKKFPETIEYIFDKETIDIDGQSITVERSGFLGFRTRKVFLAEKIKGMTTSLSILENSNFPNIIPSLSSSYGAFLIWHGRGLRPFYNFGYHVSQSDANNFIGQVYLKFPVYRYSNNS